ncbi:hypothetical protein H5410_041930 [Solanum commersonii]|uniref:SWIM-type domain-containing protein n=1 Tax=Solanum commersonii TaxID=4109 RepID=A0A9J5XW42_SOLCO|nr:hypothetical protein H5410_041930 [Solanum commersonii]
MKKLGQKCLDDLLWYNLNTWCKKYFQDYSKCDVVDNNMAESFNAWILPARYKTIITMLKEIRVKMMKRIGDLRKFSNTWIIDISHMSLKILQENIEKSMQYNLTWNGERGFEIKHHEFIHIVDIVSKSCSCRSWQLKGIPCPHGVAALHYKELEPIHYMASYYSKETYLSTYAHFIQPMNNMNMWPTSNNPIVKPPKIKKLPGRPGKVRRKEADESRKTGNLSKRGVIITCSKCAGPSQTTEPSSQVRGIGPSELAEPSSHSFEATCKGRGLERGKRPVEHEDTSGGQTRPFKRPRMVGVGIDQAEYGFTTLNPGLPSRRVINTGTRVTKRADVVTGDIGYTPVRGFKWNGKTTIISSKLERIRTEKVIKLGLQLLLLLIAKAKQLQVGRLLCHGSRAFLCCLLNIFLKFLKWMPQ